MTKANECTCPSGDGSLRHPCPAHPAVEQAGGDERDLQGTQGERDGWGPLPIVQVPWNVFDRAVMWVEDRRRYGDDGTIVDDWKALKTIQRAALAQPSPKCAACNGSGFVEFERGAVIKDCPRCHRVAQPSPAPELDFSRPLETENGEPVKWICADVIEYKSARVCVAKDTGLVYSSPYIGLKIRNVIPEQAKGFTHFPELVESVKQMDAMLKAEAERPEVVARVVHSNPVVLGQCGPLNANDELMTVAQHAASVARWAEMFNRVEQERDAALSRVAELDKQCRDDVARALGLRPSQERGFAWSYLLASIKSCVKASEDAAQAQHSVPEASEQEKEQGWTLDYSFVERVTDLAASRTEYTTSMEATEQVLLAARELLAAAPGKEVGHE
ncbi:hypothetical protein CAZ10_16725 [Pseudomonas aeruginosa]|uniref:Uncharacterized protein n=1 Tax=Pseudomonas aeruginosa TaxID=287 RepID=A0A2C9WX51_PSEAI|nr:hypothetical protein [Pseudomonas aeruginosa]OTI60726.1 hypothetical protein CAZ10_16725 [Pseudomonas aeruginosa]